jgi:phosphoenolpyruvate-protein phosphotransferase (PTS system enzyme I)
MPMPQPLERIGRPASPGIAVGPLVAFTSLVRAVEATAADSAEEQDRLAAAIDAAAQELAALLEAAEPDGQAILEFQIAMLEDSTLTEAAAELVAGGASAAAGWRGALDRQIADFADGGDDYFQARAGDLADLRDRVLRLLAGEADTVLPAGSILLGDDLAPSRFLAIDWSRGGAIILERGSPLSHVAILARARGIPMVTGLGQVSANGHAEAMVDGTSGRVVLSPDVKSRRAMMDAARAFAEEERQADRHRAAPAITADGISVKVMINVADPAEVDAVDIAHCDGIGLMRTEFLFRSGRRLPGEDEQYGAYRRLLEWAGEKPVTVRTLDAGGDKPIAGLTPDDETNTFLGVRGLRLSLARPEVFRVQLRALARAAVHGNLRVMWPMVTIPQEFTAAAALFEEELALLRRRGIACKRPPLGMMIEVPLPALMPELFPMAQFFSIGSNDLTQYLAAAARDNAAVSGLADSAYPAVAMLIGQLAAFAARQGIELSICGDLASDAGKVPDLVGRGLRSLSVAPAALARVKAAICRSRAGGGA